MGDVVMNGATKDMWDKVGIILAPVGGVFTALAVAFLGFEGSKALQHQQEFETNARVYAELTSRREEADRSLRKDIFQSVFETFVKTSVPLDQKLATLELLADNFHESFNLGPLFKLLYHQIYATALHETGAGTGRVLLVKYRRRLEEDAQRLTEAEATILKERGGVAIESDVDLEQLARSPAGIPDVISEERSVRSLSPGQQLHKRRFVLNVLQANKENKEMLIWLRVVSAGKAHPETELDIVFWLALFDFPMTNNIPLSAGERCAVVMREFSDTFARLSLLYFPEANLGFREALQASPR
jgi:hypothetical protein